MDPSGLRMSIHHYSASSLNSVTLQCAPASDSPYMTDCPKQPLLSIKLDLNYPCPALSPACQLLMPIFMISVRAMSCHAICHYHFSNWLLTLQWPQQTLLQFSARRIYVISISIFYLHQLTLYIIVQMSSGNSRGKLSKHAQSWNLFQFNYVLCTAVLSHKVASLYQSLTRDGRDTLLGEESMIGIPWATSTPVFDRYSHLWTWNL